MYTVIGGDGQAYGPVDLQTLQRWCAEGRVSPTSVLVDGVTGQRVYASSVPTLSGYFPPPTGAPYAPPSPGPGYGVQSPSPYGQNPYGQSPYGQSPYNSGQPVNPYANFPMTSYRSPKSKVIAILLAFFLGVFGAHRFYLGQNGTGIAMLLLTVLTCGYGGVITGIWATIDIVLILTDSLTDVSGARLT